MMEQLITIIIMLINVAAVLDVLLILKVFFGANLSISGKKLFIIGAVYFVLNILLECIPGLVKHTWPVVLLYMMLTVVLLSGSRRVRNLFLTNPAALMYVQWGTMFSVLEQLTGLAQYGYNYQNSEVVTPLYFVCDILLFLLLWWVMKKTKSASESITLSKTESIVLPILCILYSVAAEFFVYAEQFITHSLYKPFCFSIMLLINVAVIYAVVHRKKAAYYKLVANQYKDQFAEEYDSFRDYKANNSDLIKFRHDWNNHMLVLQKMFHQGEYERASTYFSELVDMTKGSEKPFVTGNEIVDMLLQSKNEMLVSCGIDFTVSGSLEALGFMDDVDCCILFANLLDNAIEANELCDGKRYINLSIHKTKGLLYIQMTNPYSKERTATGEKANGSVHGIGLQNVAEIIDKYQGEHSIEKRDGTFIVKCCFPV